jgi:mono/diheme cytochrome c family protein
VPHRRTILKRTAIGLVAFLLLIQLVPYGRDHSNPPATRTVAWDSPRTQKLMTGACMDCHSNLTTWPVYSNVAPISWLVQNDVDGGRKRLNLSTEAPDVDRMIRTIQRGSMPPLQYKPLHPASRLSAKDKQDLISGLKATFAAAGR